MANMDQLMREYYGIEDVNKADYISQLGDAYAQSPITQAGLENWNPQGIESLRAKQMFGDTGPLSAGAMDARAMAVGDTGLYVNPLEEQLQKIRNDAARLVPTKGGETLDDWDPMTHPGKELTRLQLQKQYYDPIAEDLTQGWKEEMGHEASHLGWEYENPYKKYMAQAFGGLNPSGEEVWNHMNDLMYGNPTNLDYLTSPIKRRWSGLSRKGRPMGPMKYQSLYDEATGNWTPAGYKSIQKSGLVPWQKGMLMQGPTTAAGQRSLQQTSDQVKAQGQAYMDPNRGNVQAPTMTSSQIRQEADRTGGTRHAGEMTQAAAREAPQPRGNAGYSNVRRYGRARGGIASLWRR
tara:strand:- start:75 stop:1124 length:1050 start_codon:yes stop_codon:yes gene_type:complete